MQIFKGFLGGDSLEKFFFLRALKLIVIFQGGNTGSFRVVVEFCVVLQWYLTCRLTEVFELRMSCSDTNAAEKCLI